MIPTSVQVGNQNSLSTKQSFLKLEEDLLDVVFCRFHFSTLLFATWKACASEEGPAIQKKCFFLRCEVEDSPTLATEIESFYVPGLSATGLYKYDTTGKARIGKIFSYQISDNEMVQPFSEMLIFFCLSSRSHQEKWVCKAFGRLKIKRSNGNI